MKPDGGQTPAARKGEATVAAKGLTGLLSDRLLGAVLIRVSRRFERYAEYVDEMRVQCRLRQAGVRNAGAIGTWTKREELRTLYELAAGLFSRRGGPGDRLVSGCLDLLPRGRTRRGRRAPLLRRHLGQRDDA